MSRWQKISLWLAFLAVASLAAYLWLAREQPEVAERLTAKLPPAVTGVFGQPATAPPTVAAEPQLAPAEGTQTELGDPALPALGSSDAEVARAVATVPGGDTALTFLVRRELLRRFVATVDQLPGKKMPVKTRLWAPVAGVYAAESEKGQLRPAAANEARYQPLVAAFLAIEPGAAVQLYRRWYPLVQAAYEELAGTGRLFQTRLIGVIDHLLTARQPPTPPALVLVEGQYRFADPTLETESVGRKLLLRLGASEAAKVQRRLGEYRALLAQPPG